MGLLRRLLGFAEPPQPELGEIASTLDGRDVTRGWVTGMTRLLPQDGILETRGGGDYELYRQVLSDTQVFSVLQQRRLALTKTEWVVNPGGDKRLDRQAAKAIEETLKAIRWDGVCGAMHFGIFYGYAVAECLWGRDGARITLEQIRVRDRRRFHFDGEQRLRLRTASHPEGELLPERKFWIYATGADHDDEPYGLGLAHWLYWPTLFKRTNIKFWLIAAEKFGSPTVMGTFPPGATPAEQAKLLATLQAIQTDAGLIVPEGMSVELLEAKRAGSADHASLCQYMDNAIAKAVIGQTMTSEATAGQYKADVQDAVKDDLVKADADLICDSFNRGPVRWLTDWNFPGAAYPTVWRQTEEAEDLGQVAERNAKVFQTGYRPTLQQTKDIYGGEWEPVSPPADPIAPATVGDGLAPAFAEGERQTAQTAIDTEGDRDPGWDPVMETLLKPIFDALEGGLTPEQVLARLDEWYPALADDDLVELLARAMTAAETLGRLEAEQ